MKSLYRTILIFSLSTATIFSSNGQNVKEITEYYPNSKKIMKVFHVLQPNKDIKHGDYKSYFKTGELKESGQYSNNNRHGTWITYSGPTTIEAKGIYNDGKKVGIWEYYKEEGEVIERYDYEKKSSLEPIIKVNLKYPTEAVRNQIEGDVKLNLIYGDNCQIIDILLVEGIGYGCDESAIASIQRGEKLRKKYSNKPIDCSESKKEIELKFRLQ